MTVVGKMRDAKPISQKDLEFQRGRTCIVLEWVKEPLGWVRRGFSRSGVIKYHGSYVLIRLTKDTAEWRSM